MKILCLALGALCLVAAMKNAAAQGFDPEILAKIDAAVEAAIADEKLPGAIVHAECPGHVFRKVYGHRALVPDKEPNAADTIYDLASLTKVMATTPAIMRLVERGKLGLDQSISRVLPDFQPIAGTDDDPGSPAWDKITIRQLLTHRSGLMSGFRKENRPPNYPEAMRRLRTDPPKAEPGVATIYSDLNFILLGEIVQRLTGDSLADYARREIWEPLRMWDTGFAGNSKFEIGNSKRIAPTEKIGDDVLRGVVHDPTCRLLGGVCGHAGVFGTIDDVVRFAKMMRNRGSLDGVRILREETVREMTKIHDGGRGLGFDINSRLAESPRGAHFSVGNSFGHTGWTGSSLWIDRERHMIVVMLANRNHPKGGDVRQMRYDVATLAVEAIAKSRAAHPPRRLPMNGIDTLRADGFKPLQGLKIGLITNHTGLTREGVPTIDLLHKAPGVELKALFGPEHGIRGKLDQAEISDGKDDKTGLPVYSLYGASRKPGAERLEGLNALVFDIQDIGCRFYTYISTMGLAMEAAAAQNLRFFVLDRVNPIGGTVVDGPVAIGERKFTSHHPIAIQHGMTVGELALMFREELGLKLDLTIVPVSHWRRHMRYDQTALKWVDPSPNMRSLNAAILYPGIGLPEFTQLSVGRGTDTPFEHVAAPYIDADFLVGELRKLELPGIAFNPTRYTPESSIFAGELCRGVRFLIHDRDQIRPIDAGLSIARILARKYPAYDLENLSKLLVHPPTLEALRAQKPLVEIRELWAEELEDFKMRREGFLLYEE